MIKIEDPTSITVAREKPAVGMLLVGVGVGVGVEGKLTDFTQTGRLGVLRAGSGELCRRGILQSLPSADKSRLR